MKIRLLSAVSVAGVLLAADSVPDLPNSIAAGLVQSGVADAHPEAVAYAEALGVPLPEALPDFSEQIAVEEAEAAAAAEAEAKAQAEAEKKKAKA